MDVSHSGCQAETRLQSCHLLKRCVLYNWAQCQERSTHFVGARVEHQGLALLFGVCPSAGRDAGPQGPGGSQPGQHGGHSLLSEVHWWRGTEERRDTKCKCCFMDEWMDGEMDRLNQSLVKMSLSHSQ